MRNFAPVNADLRRIIAARILLAVFLPMLLLAMMHTHQSVQSTGDTCGACVHHQCGGHIGQQTASIHACVLCQFLSLPYLAVAAIAVTIYNKVCRIRYAVCQRSISLSMYGVVGLRAPPSV